VVPKKNNEGTMPILTALIKKAFLERVVNSSEVHSIS
jgi:hypothetical protein